MLRGFCNWPTTGNDQRAYLFLLNPWIWSKEGIRCKNFRPIAYRNGSTDLMIFDWENTKNISPTKRNINLWQYLRPIGDNICIAKTKRPLRILHMHKLSASILLSATRTTRRLSNRGGRRGDGIHHSANPRRLNFWERLRGMPHQLNVNSPHCFVRVNSLKIGWFRVWKSNIFYS